MIKPPYAARFSVLCFCRGSRGISLRHRIECAACLEPLNLGFVQGMLNLQLECTTVTWPHHHRQWNANCNILGPNIDPVIRMYFVVVFIVHESQRQNALLLQVRLMNASEGSRNNSEPS